MKIILALTMLLLVTGCGAPAALHTTAFSIEGMTCENCVSAINTTLENTPGVVSSAVSLRDQNAIVVHDPRVLSAQEVLDAVNRLGFTATRKSE